MVLPEKWGAFDLNLVSFTGQFKAHRDTTTIRRRGNPVSQLFLRRGVAKLGEKVDTFFLIHNLDLKATSPFYTAVAWESNKLAVAVPALQISCMSSALRWGAEAL